MSPGIVAVLALLAGVALGRSIDLWLLRFYRDQFRRLTAEAERLAQLERWHTYVLCRLGRDV